MKKLLAALCFLPVLAIAQGDYPNKPVRLIVPFPPGGATDVVARLLAVKLGEGLKQQVVIENRPGAGATLATEQVASMEANGIVVQKVIIIPQEFAAWCKASGLQPNGATREAIG